MMSERCSARWKRRSSPPLLRRSAPTTAISKPISAADWVSVPAHGRRWKRVTWNPEILSLRASDKEGSGRRFQFRIEVGDDVLERRDRLLHGRDLDQSPAADRGIAVLQGYNHIPPLLLELHQR